MGELDTNLAKTALLKWGARYAYTDHYLHFELMQRVVPHQFARDKCVAKMINHQKEFDRFLFIDDDIQPPEDMLKDLMDYDKDIVGAVCPGLKRNPDGFAVAMPMAFRLKDEDLHLYNGSGFEEVDALGTGALMVKSKVFKEMGPPWFNHEFDYKERTLGQVDVIKEAGEDVNFCLKAKELGFEIWADFDIVPGHRQRFDINEFRKTTQHYTSKLEEELAEYKEVEDV